MGEFIFKTISLHQPTWKKLHEYRLNHEAKGLSDAVDILLRNDIRLKKIIERRRLRQLERNNSED